MSATDASTAADSAAAIEQAVESAPEVARAIERRRLYRLWEEGHWSATALDFAEDARDWRERLTGSQRRALILYLSMFLDGEEAVTVSLAPFLAAAPEEEDRAYLATQIADEARHHVFFDRFLAEVVGLPGGMGHRLRATASGRTWGYRQVFGALDRLAARLRARPRDRALLAQGIALYHLVIEGMLAHPGQQALLRDFGPRHGVLPGFTAGMRLLSRDESRHIAFGIGLLRRLVADDRRAGAAVIAVLDRVLPWASGVLTPPDRDWSYVTALGTTPRDLFAFALRSIETKLAAAGIPPGDIPALVKLGVADSPAAGYPPAGGADRVIALIEGGVVGTDALPRPTEATLDALFAGTRDLAAWTAPRWRGLRGTIQWHFADAAPRHLILADPVAVAVGTAPHPTLTLRCTAADWSLIAGGRLDQRRAVATGRLRLRGSPRLALRLPTILP